MNDISEQVKHGTMYVYKLTCDNGGAPCVHRGLLSLSICKPRIRVDAEVGDWVLGFGGKSKPELRDRLIYLARVTAVETTGAYYALDKYKGRPDRIYSRTSDGFEYVAGSLFHSPDDLAHDLGDAPNYDRASNLLSRQYVYFGAANGPSLDGVQDIYDGLPRDYAKNHTDVIRRQLEKFVLSVFDQYRPGRHGRPTHGDTTAKCYLPEGDDGDDITLPRC